jgi:hypothetical protein
MTMRTRSLCFALLVPLSCSLVACVAPATEEDEAVESAAQPIKGAAVASAYPEAVLLDTLQDGQLTPACSGALIAPRVVLTSARCAGASGQARVRAPFAYGDEAWARGATTYDGSGAAWTNGESRDVGLVFLDRPIYLDAYPQLAAWPLQDGALVVSVGRARDGESGSASAYVSEPVAVVSAASHGYHNDYAITALTEPLDEGGPALLPQTHTIVAVNSGTADGAALLARVDGLSNWIRQQIALYGSGGGHGWPGGPGHGDGDGDGHGHGWPGGPGHGDGDGDGHGHGWPGGPGHGDGDGDGHGHGWPGGPGHGDGDGDGHGHGGPGDGDGHGHGGTPPGGGDGDGHGWPPPGGGHGDGDGHGHGGGPPPGGGGGHGGGHGHG